MDSALFVRHAESSQSMELERVEGVRGAERSAPARVWSDAHDLLLRTKPSLVRFARHHVRLQLAPIPSTGMTRRAARTMQNPFIPTSGRNWDKVRPVFIRTEPDQVPGAAPRTLYAMANTRGHGSLCHQKSGCAQALNARTPFSRP